MNNNQVVILTKELEDGIKLKESLTSFIDDFKTVKCITKNDILECPNLATNCVYIFSTWYMPEFSEQEISQVFHSLKAIFYCAGTVKYFAEPFIHQGVKVFSSSRANGIPVAEFTAAQILLANKGYFQAQKRYHWPIWTWGFRKARAYAENKKGNYNASIGIIGCGAIGSEVIEILNSRKFKFLVYDPYVSADYLLNIGAQTASLEEIFEKCDVISNHLPDIPSTYGLINYNLLSRMKSNATFINTGRGRQVVERDLAKVLRQEKHRCALLDVTRHEPLFPWSPLYFCKNVFLTPHIAGSLSQEFNRMAEYMVDAYQNVIYGKESIYEVKLKDIEHKA